MQSEWRFNSEQLETPFTHTGDFYMIRYFLQDTELSERTVVVLLNFEKLER